MPDGDEALTHYSKLANNGSASQRCDSPPETLQVVCTIRQPQSFQGQTIPTIPATMQTTITNILGLAAVASSLAIPAQPIVKRDSISITPHDAYSSSIGVLGCKIDTNRVAYFPSMPQCGNMCLKVSANGRSLNLLHIDTSGGAYDISYDAWNYLKTGKSATQNPVMGGGFDAEVKNVDMSECADIIKTSDGKLGVSAPNAVNWFISCPNDTTMFNIQDSACTMGVDEVCTLDMAVSNQPSCPTSILGSKDKLTGDGVYNIVYGTGEEKLAA